MKVKDCAGCDGCPMQKLFPDNTFVAPKLGRALRLVVAEAPGEEESLRGEPLIGGAGKWFDNACRQAGVQREDLTLINVINCRPPQNVFPTDPIAKAYISHADGEGAVRHCRKHHLQPMLESRPWERIDVLGEKPLRYVLGKTEGIFKWRGSPLPVPGVSEKPIAMPTLHPAYIMRDQEKAPLMVHDLVKGLRVPPEKYNLQPTITELQEFGKKYKTFAFDIETNRWTQEVLMVGLCGSPTEAMVVPFKGAYWAELRRIFAQATNLIGHNCVQFDLPILHENGVTVGEGVEVWDTMLIQHLLFPGFPHDLEFVGSQFCSKPAWKDNKDNFELYCARDVDVTLQCWLQMWPMLKQHGMVDLYKYTQVPLAKICKLMGDTGIKIDPGQIESVRAKLKVEMEKLERQLPEHMQTHMRAIRKRQPAPEGTLSEKTGKPIKFIMTDAEEEVTPWRSKTEVEKFLYTELGLPVQLHLKTDKVTTGKDALERLYRKTKNPAIQAIQRLRKLDELMTTFCKEQMQSVDRMHPHFLVHGTKSGRLSSADPNLQNIPETARVIYVPSHKNWKLIEVDYSGIENKLTAHFARDHKRLERFLLDPKFSEHKHAVEVFFGIPYAEVEKDNDKDAPYGKAKRIVHGTNYGMGAQKISKMYDMDLGEVRKLLGLWKNEIAETSRWQARCAEEARKTGFLRTVFGRKRWFYTAAYYTEALSFLPQSSAADVIFRAMVGLMYERIKWPEEKARKVAEVVCPLPKPANLLLQVHDALVFECPAEQVEEVVGAVRKVMEQPWPELNGLSFTASVKVGDNWWECA